MGIELPGETCGVGERDERFGPVGVFGAGQESEFDAVPRIGDGILRFLRMWCELSEPVRLVALVRAGATFINGKLVERPGEDPQPEAA